MQQTTKYVTRSMLLMGALIVGCHYPIHDLNDSTKEPISKKVCSQSLIQKGTELYREFLLHPYLPEVIKSIDRIQRFSEEKWISYNYLYDLSKMKQKAIEFKFQYKKENCYLDPENEKRFGLNFLKFEYEVYKILSPINRIAQYNFSMVPHNDYVGLIETECEVKKKVSLDEFSNPTTYSEIKDKNYRLFKRLETLNAILYKMKIDLDIIKTEESDSNKENTILKLTEYFKKLDFFCTAYQLLDPKNECSLKSEENLKGCKEGKLLLNQFGGNYEL